MKKKVMMLCCILLSVLALAGCNADSPVKSISEAVKIEILVAETDEMVILTETGAVRHICDDLVSLKLRKMEGHIDPTILVYTLRFYDADGEQLEAIDIPADDWIMRYSDGVYSISGGELDTERMANVLLDEFRGGKLGRITLEHVGEEIL